MFSPWAHCLPGHIISWGILSPGAYYVSGAGFLWCGLSPGGFVSGTVCLQGTYSLGHIVSWGRLSQGRIILGRLSWGTFSRGRLPPPPAPHRSSINDQAGNLLHILGNKKQVSKSFGVRVGLGILFFANSFWTWTPPHPPPTFPFFSCDEQLKK